MIEKIGEFFISTFERSRGEPRSPPLHTGAPPHAPTLAEPVHERILRRSAIARTHCRTRVRSPCPRTRCSLQSHRTNCALCTPLRSMRAPNARAPHASQVVCMETCSSRSTSRSWGGRRVKVCRSPPHRTLSMCTVDHFKRAQHAFASKLPANRAQNGACAVHQSAIDSTRPVHFADTLFHSESVHMLDHALALLVGAPTAHAQLKSRALRRAWRARSVPNGWRRGARSIVYFITIDIHIIYRMIYTMEHQYS